MLLKTKSFQKTVAAAGTAEQLTENNGLNMPTVDIKALSTNAGLVYVGGSGVTSSNGYELAAGAAVSLEASREERISLSDIWLDVGTNGEGVSVLYLEDK